MKVWGCHIGRVCVQELEGRSSRLTAMAQLGEGKKSEPHGTHMNVSPPSVSILA